jgi:hypothetical protein
MSPLEGGVTQLGKNFAERVVPNLPQALGTQRDTAPFAGGVATILESGVGLAQPFHVFRGVITEETANLI